MIIVRINQYWLLATNKKQPYPCEWVGQVAKTGTASWGSPRSLKPQGCVHRAFTKQMVVFSQKKSTFFTFFFPGSLGPKKGHHRFFSLSFCCGWGPGVARSDPRVHGVARRLAAVLGRRQCVFGVAARACQVSWCDPSGLVLGWAPVGHDWYAAEEPSCCELVEQRKFTAFEHGQPLWTITKTSMSHDFHCQQH